VNSSIGLHWSPWPQWATVASWVEAQHIGPDWRPMGNPCQPTRGSGAPAHGHHGQMPNLAHRSPAKRWWTSGTDGGKTTYDTWPTCRYARTSNGMAVAESSPERSSARWWHSASRKEMA
jgi:hypothetical protein